MEEIILKKWITMFKKNFFLSAFLSFGLLVATPAVFASGEQGDNSNNESQEQVDARLLQEKNLAEFKKRCAEVIAGISNVEQEHKAVSSQLLLEQIDQWASDKTLADMKTHVSVCVQDVQIENKSPIFASWHKEDQDPVWLAGRASGVAPVFKYERSASRFKRYPPGPSLYIVMANLYAAQRRSAARRNRHADMDEPGPD